MHSKYDIAKENFCNMQNISQKKCIHYFRLFWYELKNWACFHRKVQLAVGALRTEHFRSKRKQIIHRLAAAWIFTAERSRIALKWLFSDEHKHLRPNILKQICMNILWIYVLAILSCSVIYVRPLAHKPNLQKKTVRNSFLAISFSNIFLFTWNIQIVI